MKIVMSFFDKTGNMLKPWHKNGYECHIFDIQHPEGTHKRDDGMITHCVDLSEPPEIPPSEDIHFASFFPPCTHLAVSGARWFQGKGLRALQESVGFFATSAEVASNLICPWIIENPMSTISTYWRQPDHKFHPCHYSGYAGGIDYYTKETWLWTSNNFVMPPRDMPADLFMEPDRNYIHNQPPGEERANIRSATPESFAIACYYANREWYNL